VLERSLAVVNPQVAPQPHPTSNDAFDALTAYDPVIADGEHLDLAAPRLAARDAWPQATAALTVGLTG